MYGGIVESIASLGIVTSAAGGDASTCKPFCFILYRPSSELLISKLINLVSKYWFITFGVYMLFGSAVNIVSLALANLLGGLFIIVHNVSDSFIFVHWSFLS